MRIIVDRVDNSHVVPSDSFKAIVHFRDEYDYVEYHLTADCYCKLQIEVSDLVHSLSSLEFLYVQYEIVLTKSPLLCKSLI